MKLLHTFIICALFFNPFNPVFGQKKAPSNAHLLKTFSFFPNADPRLNHHNFFAEMAAQMHLSDKSVMVLTEQATDQLGITHFKYQQFHDGLPVFGCRYILHEQDGRILHANGRYSPQADVSPQPGITAATAVGLAKRAMNAQTYHERQAEPLLCFLDPAFPEVSEYLRLVYQVDIHSTAPFDKRRYFVDATNGKILSQFPLILNEGVPSTAKTRYYGTQHITTDSLAPQHFVLRDPTRGQGIFVLDNLWKVFTSTSSAWNLTNANRDEIALDAHYCAQEYYDMMLADYDWQGLDGNGKALNVRVHAGNFVNAFWDGESSHYGDGDCNYGPLTTLEVVGHEFTHGMIDYTSRLVYSSESGAINECLADIFGKLLERKTDPGNFSWALGHSFILNPESTPFRVMNDPNSKQMPAYYKGNYWFDGGGVHTNSAIGNLWFTMLVDGKQGVNEAGLAFSVPAIGADKAGQIVFQTNRFYLTESSNYNAFYHYSLAVAEAMFGAGSTEAFALKEAWKAVGLPSVPQGDVFDLRLSAPGFEDKNYCGIGQYLPVKFKVVNSGTVAYYPSMMGTISLANWLLTPLVVELKDTIAPGEVQNVEVTNWLLAEELGFNSVSIQIDIADDYPNNNTGYVHYNVAEFQSNDLQLYTFGRGTPCFAPTQLMNVYVTNNSCETVPVGTVLSFSATDDSGNLLWSSPPYSLLEELPGAGTLFLNYDIPTSYDGLNITLVHANDPNPYNNVHHVYQDISLPITGNYLNTFEQNFGMDGYLLFNSNTNLPSISYQNSAFFATTGVFNDPNSVQRCVDPFSVFDFPTTNGVTATLHACVDLSHAANPKLEFDLAQFRNLVAELTNDPYSSILQVKWEGNENGAQYFYGQPEGVVVHHNISLPAYFKGALTLSFYTEMGKWNIVSGNLGTDDFLLLDNLELSALSSNTTDVSPGSSIRVVPNPATNITTVSATEGLKSVQLQNPKGQILRTLELDAEQYSLDLNGLSNGVYFLNIQLANGQRVVKKLVKME